MMRPVFASITDAERHFVGYLRPLPFLSQERKEQWARTTVIVALSRGEIAINSQLRFRLRPC